MGATYTRQSTYTDGDIIQASNTNNEFDQLLAAFAASTGHSHDGTTGEGGPITKLLGTGITIGDGSSGTDITVTFDGESNDGVLKWMEDEDYFEFSDDILIASTEKIQFRDTGLYINSSADGQLDIVADTEIQIAATTVDINGLVDISGNLSVGGNLDVTGTFDLSDANFTNAGDIQLDSISGDADTNTSITFSGSDVITVATGGSTAFTVNADQSVTFSGNVIIGSANIAEAELEILDGATVTTAEINIIDGDTSATSTTVADADRVVLNDNGTMVQVAVTDLAAYFDDEITAMPNLVTTAATTVGALNSGSITSGFGTIDTGSSTITTTGLISGGSLDIDNVLINGTTIGHTDDTDLITLADGVVAVAGQITGTGFTGTLDGILGSGTAAAATVTSLDTSGVVNLNLTTESSSSTTGALIVDGGVGIAKKLFVGTDFDVSNNAVIDGTLTVGGALAKVAGKESIWIPAAAMYPSTTNPCSDLTQVETTALRPDLKCLDFAAAADDFAQFSIAFPKSWDEGTITFQPFWTVTGTNTGTVAWGLAGIAVSNDDSINTAFGTIVVTTALAHSGTSNDLMVSVESGAVTIAGSPAANDVCFFQVNRDVSADNQSGAARLLGIKLFFTTDAKNDA